MSRAKVDKIWATLIKQRDGFRCRMCGSAGSLNAHHVFGKRSRILRYSISNGVTLCASCHLYRVHGSNGRIALDALKKIREIVGEDTWAELERLEKDKAKLSLAEAYERLTG